MTHEDVKKRFEEEFGIAFSHDQKCNCCPDLLVLKDATVRFLLAEVERAYELGAKDRTEEILERVDLIEEHRDLIEDRTCNCAEVFNADLRSKFLTPKA